MTVPLPTRPHPARHREVDRLEVLRQSELMDTAPEPAYDTVVDAAARLLGTPMATFTLVDDHRQWFKAAVGMHHHTDPREHSLCALVVDADDVLVVPDARLDPRFAAWPAVRSGGFVSYAGVPVSGRDGMPLGALCVLDVEPRDFGADAIATLQGLATLVAAHLDLRRRDLLVGVDPATVGHDASALVDAVASGQLRVHYQPIVDLVSGDVARVEALVRWHHPTRGVITPAEFLHTADSAGLSSRVDRWVMQAAATEVARWRRDDPALAELGVAVNVTMSPQLDRLWVADLEAVLDATGLPAAALTVEINERSVGSVSPVAHAALEWLVEEGGGVAVDDVGTGSSSLLRLTELPVTELKIDQSFVRGMTLDRHRAAVVAALAELGRELELVVVAEGVEDAVTAGAAGRLGCHLGQGHLWSAPVEAVRVPDLVRRVGSRLRHA